MRLGLKRGAALFAMTGAASLALTFGPGVTAAGALEDILKDDKKCVEKGVADKKDGEAKDQAKEQDKAAGGDKEARAGEEDKKDEGDKGLFDKDLFEDKDLFGDKDKDKCAGAAAGGGGGGGGVIVAGGGAAVPVGGVAAGGGGTALDGDAPVWPIAGAGLGALLVAAGLHARRRGDEMV